MTYAYNPEFWEVLEPLLPTLSKSPKADPGDIEALRSISDKTLAFLISKLPTYPTTEEALHYAKTKDQYELPIRSFTKNPPSNSSCTPAIIFSHGGGMISGSTEIYSKYTAHLAETTGFTVFAPEYRLAPEATRERGPEALVEDVYACLQWVHENAERLKIDPNKIILMGDSAGGGISAGVALMARDRQILPPVARLVLIYPMLDDRTILKPANLELKPFLVWTDSNNTDGWQALLGKEKAGDLSADVSYYAAPSRSPSLKGLPPTYMDVGGLDLFASESMQFATRLVQDGVYTEFHLIPGMPHGFEKMDWKAEFSRTIRGEREKWYTNI